MIDFAVPEKAGVLDHIRIEYASLIMLVGPAYLVPPKNLVSHLMGRLSSRVNSVFGWHQVT